MAKQFTKQEAFSLFGQTVLFKKTIYFEHEELKFPLVNKGTVSQICMVQNQEQGITVSMIIDENFTELDKEGFERYCQVIESGGIHNACVV